MSRHFLLIFIVSFWACGTKNQEVSTAVVRAPFAWENATVYFLMTDRFNNAVKENDFQTPAGKEAAPYRGFMGGDLQGVIEKIKDGYFDSLGITALWTTPVVQNVDGSVDEGTGRSYGFHGYWTKDWTEIEPKLGTKADFQEMVDEAHKHGIKVIVDVVLNHTGPVTELDKVWPADWVRTSPECVYKDKASTVTCTLVKNLPDIRTDDDSTSVALPDFLVEKWKKEGRYDQEVAELESFFASTGYVRSGQNYIIKWLVDFVLEYGVDGFRVDTAKHVEGYVWQKLWKQAKAAFEKYKKEHPDKKYDDSEFYMVGEVYNYGIGSGPLYNYNDQKENFYTDGFNSLINFDFKYDAKLPYQEMHEKYDNISFSPAMDGKWVLNYLSSHDDGGPYDPDRTKTYEAANRLLLSHGAAQIYYGEETARSLTVVAEGDAKLRSFMNWEDLEKPETKALLTHWKKLGQFRKAHTSIGAGRHTTLSTSPYVFSRTLTFASTGEKDVVVIALEIPKGSKSIKIGKSFAEGTKLIDYYSGKSALVKNGMLALDTPYDIVLLSK